MKKVIFKSGVVLGVSDRRAALIMAAISQDVDNGIVFIGDEMGAHECCFRLTDIDAVIDYNITYEKNNQ